MDENEESNVLEIEQINHDLLQKQYKEKKTKKILTIIGIVILCIIFIPLLLVGACYLIFGFET